MERINFTEENLAQLKDLAVEFLFNRTTFNGPMSTQYDVTQVIHDTTMSSLKSMFNSIKSAIDKKSNVSRWTTSTAEQKELKILEDKKEFLDLLMGYKLYQAQEAEVAREAEALRAEIKSLEEDTKTPEEKLKEKKEALSKLENFFKMV